MLFDALLERTEDFEFALELFDLVYKHLPEKEKQNPLYSKLRVGLNKKIEEDRAGQDAFWGDLLGSYNESKKILEEKVSVSIAMDSLWAGETEFSLELLDLIYKHIPNVEEDNPKLKEIRERMIEKFESYDERKKNEVNETSDELVKDVSEEVLEEKFDGSEQIGFLEHLEQKSI